MIRLRSFVRCGMSWLQSPGRSIKKIDRRCIFSITLSDYHQQNTLVKKPNRGIDTNLVIGNNPLNDCIQENLRGKYTGSRNRALGHIVVILKAILFECNLYFLASCGNWNARFLARCDPLLVMLTYKMTTKGGGGTSILV